MQLLVPYFIWSTLFFLARGVYSFDQFFKIVYHPDSYLWFLWALFWINMILLLSQKIAATVKCDEMIILLAFCGFLSLIMVVFDFRKFDFQDISYELLFFTLGYSIGRFRLIIRSNTVLIFLSLLWLCMAWYCSMLVLPAWMPSIPFVPSSLLLYSYRGLTAVIAIMILMGTAPKVLHKDDGVNSVMARCGEVSLGIYVVHWCLIGLYGETLKDILSTISTSMQIVAIFIIIATISLFLVTMINRNKTSRNILLGKIS